MNTIKHIKKTREKLGYLPIGGFSTRQIQSTLNRIEAKYGEEVKTNAELLSLITGAPIRLTALYTTSRKYDIPPRAIEQNTMYLKTIFFEDNRPRSLEEILTEIETLRRNLRKHLRIR